MEQLDIFVKERNDEEVDDGWGTSRDPDTPDRKRKTSDDRQPESPPEIERKHAPNNWQREKQYRNHPDAMDTDSPASYPKHLMGAPPVDASRYHREAGYQDHVVNGKIGTPVLSTEEGRGMHGGYEPPPYRGSTYHGSGGNYYDNGHYQGQTPPRSSHGHYLPEMDTSPHYGAAATPNSQQDVFMRPRRWACDYCHVATFVSYEEACAHEEICARQYHERYGRPPPQQPRGPVPHYERGQQQQGAMYQGSTDLGRPPMWGSRGSGPPMPPLGPPIHDGYYHHQYHPQGPYPPHHVSPQHHQHHGYPPARYGGYPGYDARPGGGQRRDMYQNQNVKRMLLAMPTDSDSLSDRQCYVRSEMVEIFAASEKDVAARHSKGAQKLVQGQVGIRCVHCSHLRPRDRAERAVCYPSSISRIYQTVADMQRFHFEQCREIPMETRKIYKTLKTTRPRGVGSPQTYWVQSAKLLDLVDSKDGIRFGADLAKEEQEQQQQLVQGVDEEDEHHQRSPSPSDIEPAELKEEDAEPLHQTPERSEHQLEDSQGPTVPEVTA
ncbi:hypothetical protein IV203_024106 [Nitzschia inconspicua]|uniref:Uncharacterized protein n=1 Tax=Nitzschia inconspicua TaxID=303405 RepID=A0A9K3KCP5_9STRA|nr:hypothetical protein IV203_024106 [Nitzschia inconspicua]